MIALLGLITSWSSKWHGKNRNPWMYPCEDFHAIFPFTYTHPFSSKLSPFIYIFLHKSYPSSGKKNFEHYWTFQRLSTINIEIWIWCTLWNVVRKWILYVTTIYPSWPFGYVFVVACNFVLSLEIFHLWTWFFIKIFHKMHVYAWSCLLSRASTCYPQDTHHQSNTHIYDTEVLYAFWESLMKLAWHTHWCHTKILCLLDNLLDF
jgi:hypothetical protein